MTDWLQSEEQILLDPEQDQNVVSRDNRQDTLCLWTLYHWYSQHSGCPGISLTIFKPLLTLFVSLQSSK